MQRGRIDIAFLFRFGEGRCVVMGEFVRFEQNGAVGEVVLCRPNELNTMGDQFFVDYQKAMDEADANEDVRVIIVRAEGRMFSAGLDLKSNNLMGDPDASRTNQSGRIFGIVKKWQKAISAPENTNKPVIALVHGYCIGGAIDLITAVDIRLCTEDSKFAIQETKLGIVADIGTLQRLEKVVNKGLARQTAFTGERFGSKMAEKMGLVNEVYANQDILLEEGRKLAAKIATNSPRAVQGTKISLRYAENHTTNDSLDQIAYHNASFLDAEDIAESVTAFMTKQKPNYRAKL